MTAFTYLGVSLSRKQRNKGNQVTACCTKASFYHIDQETKNLDSLKYLPYLILNGFIVIIILQRLFTQTNFSFAVLTVFVATSLLSLRHQKL